MVRRMSSSQLRSKIRQAQQKQQQAVNKYNQQVRQRNQKLRQAVNKYNQEVRAYNARVRAHRTRLTHEFNRLKQQKVTVRFTVYQRSVYSLHDSYFRLENQFGHQSQDSIHNWFLDLSERETANCLEVANQLISNETEPLPHSEDLKDAELRDHLKVISPELDNRWQGALYSLNENNPDAARHFCTSAREIFTQILEIKAPNNTVLELIPDCDTTEYGIPTRRAKIRYLLSRQGIEEESFEEFVEQDIENILQLFIIFNEGTHGSAGKYSLVQLTSIKKRVQDGVFFLTEIAKDA